jgi:hypothetical protein
MLVARNKPKDIGRNKPSTLGTVLSQDQETEESKASKTAQQTAA